MTHTAIPEGPAPASPAARLPMMASTPVTVGQEPAAAQPGTTGGDG